MFHRAITGQALEIRGPELDAHRAAGVTAAGQVGTDLIAQPQEGGGEHSPVALRMKVMLEGGLAAS